jgi:hypothetical protein
MVTEQHSARFEVVSTVGPRLAQGVAGSSHGSVVPSGDEALLHVITPALWPSFIEGDTVASHALLAPPDARPVRTATGMNKRLLTSGRRYPRVGLSTDADAPAHRPRERKTPKIQARHTSCQRKLLQGVRRTTR